ncbi:hypothetical protein [Pueribacillus sp. YX66]|uniref:hypothetical protein n=1 Tax=Pueribacillus sp. YX66 TaxID=3229242 RepID=UPI00358D7302
MSIFYEYGTIVELIYIDRHERLSQRKVFILSERNDSLLAYCYTKRRIRSFLLNNILGVRKVNTL